MMLTMQDFYTRAIKFNSVLFAGALITFLLFYFMQTLIATNNGFYEPPRIVRIIDATLPLIKPPELITIERPEAIELPEPPPVDLSSKPLVFGPPSIPGPRWEDPPRPSAGDGRIPLSRHMVPLVRATAPYPARAAQRGIEGYVELSFTVNARGGVENPLILFSEPEGVFDRAALNSIGKWQYSPALDNGTPIAVHDVRQRIVFQMSED